jgi:HTH-type transcriptional regulator/antitoxin HipB
LKRKEKNLTQSELAKLLEARRKWVLHLGGGNPKAEIGLILRAIEVLGLRACLADREQLASGPHGLEKPRLLKSSNVCNAAC